MTETLERRASLYKLLSIGFLYPGEQAAQTFPAWPAAEMVSSFNQVFLGARGVPPYECEFSCSNEFEKARHLADIAGFYHAFAVEPRGERPDHISSEMEFLHLLLAKEIEARRKNNPDHLEVTLDAERKFFREHVSRWTPAFIGAVRERAPEDSFYRHLCGLLEEFLAHEGEMFGEAPCESC
jgi:TorA maturation chaperone TorD